MQTWEKDFTSQTKREVTDKAKRGGGGGDNDE